MAGEEESMTRWEYQELTASSQFNEHTQDTDVVPIDCDRLDEIGWIGWEVVSVRFNSANEMIWVLLKRAAGSYDGRH